MQRAYRSLGCHISTCVLDAHDHSVQQHRPLLIIFGSKYQGFEFLEPLPVNARRNLRDAIGAVDDTQGMRGRHRNRLTACSKRRVVVFRKHLEFEFARSHYRTWVPAVFQILGQS